MNKYRKHRIYKAEDGSEAKTGVILRALEAVVCKYDYLVSGGWRFIIKMQETGDEEAYYHLDVQSSRGGGDYAEAKMATLEQFPERAATGGDELADLLDVLKDWADTEWYERISELESIDVLTEGMWYWLRSEVGFVPCYGGIRIPYEAAADEGGEIRTESGEIRIAFSGASAEQDVFFALAIFKALNDANARLNPNTQSRWSLCELEKVPVAKFWIDLLGIEEV